MMEAAAAHGFALACRGVFVCIALGNFQKISGETCHKIAVTG
jgi:hypothetical protein